MSEPKAQYEPSPSLAQQAVQVMRALWCCGGITAEQCAQGLPELIPLLQAVIGDAQQPSAYTLTEPLLNAMAHLSSEAEWHLCLLALHPDFRTPWLKLAAARCKEAGTMADPQVLLKLIGELGNASEWVLEATKNADGQLGIVASPLTDLERDLLGFALHENSAIPALSRILKNAYELQQLKPEQNTAIAEVDPSGKNFAANWCAGRLLVLPQTASLESPINSNSLKPDGRWLLTPPSENNQNLNWQSRLIDDPWQLLFCLVLFTQEAWAAEQRGGLVLELPNGQNPFAPQSVRVLVQGAEGNEQVIGDLAEFILAVLDALEITLYPYKPSPAQLNNLLSPVISQCLQQKLALYKDGSRGEPGQFRIHPNFSDACYSLPLAPIFGRKSKALQQVIKQTALNLRDAALIQAKNQPVDSTANPFTPSPTHIPQTPQGVLNEF